MSKSEKTDKSNAREIGELSRKLDSANEEIVADHEKLAAEHERLLIQMDQSERAEESLSVANEELKSSYEELVAQQEELSAHYEELRVEIERSRQTEEALRESADKLRGLFDHMTSGVVVYEAVDDATDFIIRDFNPAAALIERKRAEEVIGKRVTEAFPRAEAFGILDVFRNVWKTGKPEYYAATLYTDEYGVASWRENCVYKLTSGEVVAVYKDVTERKNAETALAERVDQLHMLSSSVARLLEPMATADLFGYVCDQCKAIAGRAIIAVNEYIPCSNEVFTRSMTGPEDKMEKAVRILGRSPIGMAFPVSEGTRECMVGAKLGRLEGGLYELAFGQIPLPLCKEIEQELDIGEIYAMPMVLSDDFVGTVAVMTDRAEGLRNPDVIESLVNQAGLAAKRNQAEEALKASEVKFRTIFETVTEGFALNELICDESGKPCDVRFLDVNPAFEQHTGLKRADVLGHMATALFGNAETIWLHEYEKAISTGECSDFEAWFGPLRRCFHVRACRVEGMRFAVVFDDITERKLAETSLRESEERLRIAKEAARLGIYDVSGGVTTWDDRVREIWGVGPDVQITNDIFAAGIHPDDRARVLAEMEELDHPDGVGYYHSEYRVVNMTDGIERWVAVTGHSFLDDGQPVRFVGIVQDITERKKAEESLRQTNEMLSALIGSSPLAINTLDSSGNVTSWNRASEAIFGWTAAEVMGQPPPFVPHDAEDGFLANVSRVQSGATLNGAEFRRVHKDGAPIDVRIWAAPIRGQDGQVVGSMAVLQDITERKQLRAQLRQSQRLEAVGRLAGGMAHEFKNLLMGISSYAEMLQMSLGPDHQEFETANELLQCVDRAAKVVGKLQAFGSRQSLDMQPTDVNLLVADSKGLLERLLGEQMEMTLDPCDEPAIANIDPSQIEQVLTNLAINARDAMPGGGRLAMRIRVVSIEDAGVRQSFDLDQDRYVEISVTDTGSGMDEATRNQIFEPFFTTKGKDGSMGLGLSVSYGIVRQHKGFIDVKSDPGEGSTFLVYLPAAECASVIDDKHAAHQPRGGTETILLAEDEEIVRMPVKSLLEGYGYTVLTADDGQHAIELFRDHADEIDLAVLDLVMPKAGGMHVWQVITETRPDVKVLFMSGHIASSVHEDFMPPSNVPIMTKPFSVLSLADKIREILD